MDRDKKEVTKPPVKWQERVEEILLDDMPDAPYFASWVAENINYQYPVVNPWDYSRRYSLQKVSFHSSWAGVLVSMAIEYEKLKEQYPDDPELWYPHKDTFEGVTDKDLRNFYKMRHLGLIRPCPTEIANKQPEVVDQETGKRKKGSSGRFQPTEHAFVFLANELSVPFEMTILRNRLVGLSGHFVNMARVLFEWQGFNFSALTEPPEHIQEPICIECGEQNIPFYLSDMGDVLCHQCVKPVRNRFYRELVRPLKRKLKKLKLKRGDRSTAERLRSGWKNQHRHLYQTTRFGVTEEIVVDLDIGSKGAVALPEATLRRFLNRREKRRRKLAEQKARKQEKDSG
jgi:hypothetical protein